MVQFKEGTTRMVFILSDFVIKIPSLRSYRAFLKGILGNLNETKFHKHNKGFYEGHLARVCFSSWFGLFIVAENVSGSVVGCEVEIREVKKKFKLPCENKLDSWGRCPKTNKLKCVDYGDN